MEFVVLQPVLRVLQHRGSVHLGIRDVLRGDLDEALRAVFREGVLEADGRRDADVAALHLVQGLAERRPERWVVAWRSTGGFALRAFEPTVHVVLHLRIHRQHADEHGPLAVLDQPHPVGKLLPEVRAQAVRPLPRQPGDLAPVMPAQAAQQQGHLVLFPMLIHQFDDAVVQVVLLFHRVTHVPVHGLEDARVYGQRRRVSSVAGTSPGQAPSVRRGATMGEDGTVGAHPALPEGDS